MSHPNWEIDSDEPRHTVGVPFLSAVTWCYDHVQTDSRIGLPHRYKAKYIHKIRQAERHVLSFRLEGWVLTQYLLITINLLSVSVIFLERCWLRIRHDHTTREKGQRWFYVNIRSQINYRPPENKPIFPGTLRNTFLQNRLLIALLATIVQCFHIEKAYTWWYWRTNLFPLGPAVYPSACSICGASTIELV